ncbi:PaaI family thioesterase [Euzebya sp.]|uniref:PaaI family thioesterase n=1 Tax=Euzebya sp. TaxID=1971409 RepID=UPI003512A4A0
MPSMDAPQPIADRPRYPDEMADVAAELDGIFRRTPMYAVLGIALVDWGLGWSVLELRPSPSMGNLAGSLHGGATFAVADAAFEVACNSYGRAAVALETTAHYHRPAPLDAPVTAEAWEISRGHRTATYRLQVRDGDEVLTSYLALAYRTSRWHLPAERFPDGWG